jgi:flagellar biosynthesis protein FlgN
MAQASPHSTLQDELKLINCLIDLMKQEQQFLVAANTDGLETLTPLKNQLVDQLAALSTQRHAALQADGFAASEVGMEAWLVRMSNPAANAAWKQLLDQTREAKEQNRINGMLINKQLSANHTLLNAMRAPAGGGENAFYGPSGQTTSITGKRGVIVG